MSRRALTIAAIFALAIVALLVWKRDSFTTSDEGEERAGLQAQRRGESAPGVAPLLPPSRLGSSAERPVGAGGTVSGRVVDAVTGQAVAFVDVVFGLGTEEAVASADEDGHYETFLAAGTYSIRAIGEGVIAGPLPALRVIPSAKLSLDIPVTRLATLRGKVVSAKGRGLADVEILLRSDTASGAAFPQRGEIGVTTSERDGSFELQVPPGVADLEAKIGTTTVFASMPEVAAGATLEGLRIVMDRRGIMRGYVSNPDGGPAAGAEVMLSYRREGTSAFENRMFTTDSAGGFLARDLAPVEYVLEARHRPYAPSGPQHVTLSPEMLEVAVQLELNTPATISGRVVDSAGQPVGNAQVAQVWIDSKQRFNKLETYADGAFAFEGVGPGPHMIRARKDGYADAIKEGVMAPTKDLQLVLSAVGGIQGSVADSQGQAVPRFTITYTDTSSGATSSSQFASADGSFQLYPVSPGSYRIDVSVPEGSAKATQEVIVPAGAYGDVAVKLSTEAPGAD